MKKKKKGNNLAYRYRFYPTPAQISLLIQMMGNHRWVYNWGLNIKIEEYNRWVKKGKPENFVWLTYDDLAALLVKKKKEVGFEWLNLASSHSLQQALRHLFTAFENWFEGTGKYPVYKKKFDNRAVHFTNYVVTREHITNTEIKLPKGLGIITPVFHRPFSQLGKLENVVIKLNVNQWYVILNFEVPDSEYYKPYEYTPKLAVAEDTGVAIFCATAHQRTITTPISKKKLDFWVSENFGVKETAKLKELEKKRKKLQKVAARKQKSWKRRHKNDIKATKRNLEKVRLKIAKTYQKERNIKNDLIQKVSHHLASGFKIVAREELPVKRMTKSAKGTIENPGVNVKAKSGLNREMLRVGIGNLYTITKQKLDRFRGIEILVNPKNTSITCSECFHCNKLNRNRSKSQARFHCVACGFQCNADTNAARVIYILALIYLAETNPKLARQLKIPPKYFSTERRNKTPC